MCLGKDGYFVHLKYESQNQTEIDEYLIFTEGTLCETGEVQAD